MLRRSRVRSRAARLAKSAAWMPSISIAAGARRLQPDEAAAERGLARAGFAHEADALARCRPRWPRPSARGPAGRRGHGRSFPARWRGRSARDRWGGREPALRHPARDGAAPASRRRSPRGEDRRRGGRATARPAAGSRPGSAPRPSRSAGRRGRSPRHRSALGTAPRMAISRGTRRLAGGSDSRRPRRVGMEGIALDVAGGRRPRAASRHRAHGSGRRSRRRGADHG